MSVIVQVSDMNQRCEEGKLSIESSIRPSPSSSGPLSWSPVVHNYYVRGNVSINLNEANRSSSTSDKRRSILNEIDQEELNERKESKRTLNENDLHLMADNIAKDWQKIGKALGLREVLLYRIDHDHGLDHRAKVYQMLYRWLQWKHNEATVGNITKKLFKQDQIAAIKVLKP